MVVGEASVLQPNPTDETNSLSKLNSPESQTRLETDERSIWDRYGSVNITTLSQDTNNCTYSSRLEAPYTKRLISLVASATRLGKRIFLSLPFSCRRNLDNALTCRSISRSRKFLSRDRRKLFNILIGCVILGILSLFTCGMTMVWKKAIAESTIQDDMIESSIWDSDYQRKVWEMFWGYRTTNLQERTLRTSKDTPKGPKLVIAGKMTVDDAPCNIAQLTLKTEIWSLTERIQLSLYNSYSGGEVYSLLANHTFEASSSEENIGPVFESEDKENFSRSKSYDDHRGDDLIVVGAFDTTYRNSQVTYCSVGAWNGKELSKVGEGLCNSALSKGMKITAAAFAGPQDVYVAGSFVTQVWNGERHEFVKIYNIAHYNAVEQVWLPIPVGQITCSWCTVTVLALAWDSIRRQLHVAGKFNAIDGRNIPSALAIYDANSGHLVAHPGGGLTMYNRTQDGVATALQLDEEAGVLYIMGSFERVGDGRFCAGLAALEINNSQWTCLADAAHSVMPSGGGNMLLTPYGLMVAGRTTSFTTWPDSSRPYTIALLKAKLKNKEEKGKKRGGSNSNDLKNMNKTVSVAHENMEASHNYEWSWLPGFIGHTGPLHTLANGFGEYEGTVFIGGENFVGRWYYEERTEVEKTSGANQSPSHSGTGTTQTTLEPVTINLSQDHVRGAIMAIAQLDPRSQNNSQNTNVLGYTIAVYFIALGALLGMFLALLCNRSLNQTILSIIFAKDAQTKGISLDTLTYSAVENTNVAEAYQRAMRIRFVQHPHLLTLIDPQEIILHRIIGEGTFGRVWSAKWRSASVAVKEFVFAQAAVAGRSTQQRNIIEEIIGEAGMMAILRHPHVLQLFGCSLTAQAIWIVSELCSLGSLRQLLDDKDRDLPLVLRLKIALQVAEGMMYLHNQDPPIIHRDLKSHNIFVHETFTDTSTDLGSPVLSERSIRNDKSEESHLLNGEINYPYRYDQSDTSSKFHSEATVIAKIGDWGSARATLAGSRTMTHGVGTACWLAPEVIKYARSSKYSDVYGYGIILWELATREEVYAGLESTQIIANVANENLRPPIVDECPWSDLMVTCWSENPTDRMTFVEIVKELNKILAAVIEEDQSSQNLSRQSSFSHSSYQYHQNEETI